MGGELPSQLNLAGSGFARMRGLGGPLSECSVAGVSRASLTEEIKLRKKEHQSLWLASAGVSLALVRSVRSGWGWAFLAPVVSEKLCAHLAEAWQLQGRRVLEVSLGSQMSCPARTCAARDSVSELW